MVPLILEIVQGIRDGGKEEGEEEGGEVVPVAPVVP